MTLWLCDEVWLCTDAWLMPQEQVEEMKKKEDRLEKQMAEVMAENKRLVEPLQKARDEVDELRRQLSNYEKDKQALAVSEDITDKMLLNICFTNIRSFFLFQINIIGNISKKVISIRLNITVLFHNAVYVYMN